MKIGTCILLAIVALNAPAQVPPLPPRTLTTNTVFVTFAWNLSPSTNVAGQKLRYGPATNDLRYVVDLGPTNQSVTIYVAGYPVWARVYCVNVYGEESASELAGVGTNLVVTNVAQTSSNLTVWQDAFIVNVVTNPPNQFVRLRQAHTVHKWKHP